jgi:putative transposase
MPRYAREKSESKVYHVMLRGIARMPLCRDDEDRIRILETLAKMKQEQQYELFAYCLMDNHIHLLLKEGEETVQKSLKRIGVSYAYYFNKKYSRVGHVFQDRFRSEAVEDDIYFLAVANYIHNNPVKAGIVEKAIDYPWSSFREYIKPGIYSELVNRQLLLDMFSHNEEKAIKELIEFTKQMTPEVFIDVDNKNEKPQEMSGNTIGLIDQAVKNKGYELSEIKDIKDKAKRNEILRELKGNIPTSGRELARILGISKDIIFRA